MASDPPAAAPAGLEPVSRRERLPDQVAGSISSLNVQIPRARRLTTPRHHGRSVLQREREVQGGGDDVCQAEQVSEPVDAVNEFFVGPDRHCQIGDG
jgi:hypothetical protein